MSAERVCAIVVTYHPSAADLQNLYALATEFAHIVVVDNGSAAENLAALRGASSATGALLIENGENLGIATALNHGLTWALQQGFELAFLFDQDSLMVPGFLAAMLAHYDAAPSRESLGAVSPIHLDRVYGTEILPRPGPRGNPVTITSGVLLPIAVFRQIGPLLDAFFMDHVDTEYCLRLIQNGYRIDICREACLRHSIGHPKRVQLFGKTIFTLTNHGPNSRYYSVRNRIWIIRRYWSVFPRFSLVMAQTVGHDLIKIIFGETAKYTKLSRMLRGAWDGLLGRGGPYRAA